MQKRRFPLITFGMLLFLAAGCAQNTQSFVPYADPFFRVQSETGKDRHGAPTVTGYVFNNYGSPVENLEILVEAIDDSGKVVARRVVRLPGAVPTLGRAYFDVKVPAPAASYRVSVYGMPFPLRGV